MIDALLLSSILHISDLDIARHLLWIDHYSELEVPDDLELPTVIIPSYADWLAFAKQEDPEGFSGLGGIYERDKQAIILNPLMSEKILIHELVHHIQYSDPKYSDLCLAKLEVQAYTIEILWLKQQELDFRIEEDLLLEYTWKSNFNCQENSHKF